MTEKLKPLCDICSPSGNENDIREYVLNEISDCCTASVDQMGNILAFKKGTKPALHKVMADAHIDEVGFIVTDICENGMLRFETVGGIKSESLLCKRVIINNLPGVIGSKPIHLSAKSERSEMPGIEDLYIDIGANSKEDAEKYVSLGDIGTFLSEFKSFSGGTVKAKSLDDRVGVMTLINILKGECEYDFYATFTVGEEIGCKGAKTAAYTVDPEFAVVLEATTACDIHGTPTEKQVSVLGDGPVISFMDRANLYDRELYDLAFKIAERENIKIQSKKAVAGGNNSGSISLSKGGVRTIAVSLPCRYIHSSSSLGRTDDMENMQQLVKGLIESLASGDFNASGDLN